MWTLENGVPFAIATMNTRTKGPMGELVISKIPQHNVSEVDVLKN